MMQNKCFSSSALYKVLFVIICYFIMMEYIFRSFKEPNSDTHITNNTTTKKLEKYIPNSNFSNGVVEKDDFSFTNPFTSYINTPPTTFTELPQCLIKISKLDTKFHLKIEDPLLSPTELEEELNWLEKGGHWSPFTCKRNEKVAIIVPFRCRGEHLLFFLRNIHPFLKKQLIDYTIFVVEQYDQNSFNRGMLMNVGFVEALKFDKYDCFIFHDVDLLPEDIRNTYNCPEQPRHMSVAINVLEYKLPYKYIFGGVSAISTEHFKRLNGFSNSFWGWGGEDDDLSNRIRFHGLKIIRDSNSIARYTMLPHKKEKANPKRNKIMKAGLQNFNVDGLNSLNYQIVSLKQNKLYTWILVDLKPPS